MLFDILWPNVNLVGDWSKLAFFYQDAGTIKGLVRKGLKSNLLVTDFGDVRICMR